MTTVREYIDVRVQEEVARTMNKILNRRGGGNNSNYDHVINPSGEAILKSTSVKALTGISVPTIYRLVALNRFPAPVKLSDQASGWLLSEVLTWIEQKKQERDAKSEGVDPSNKERVF
jgi:prophage regulatory protein